MNDCRVLVLLGDPRLPDPVKREGQFNEEDFEVIARLRDALATLEGYAFEYLDDHTSFIATLAATRADLVLNLCDEGLRNAAALELHVPVLLEVFGHPYTGSGPACLALCARKHVVHAIAEDLGIAVPQETYLGSVDENVEVASFPRFVKPATSDGSFGITRRSIVHSLDELHAALKSTFARTEAGVLVQSCLLGREYSVALVNDGRTALPILEVDYSQLPTGFPKLLPDEAKWDPTSVYWRDVRYKQAVLEPKKASQLVSVALRLFERLECRDYARFDFREDERGEPHLLEVNPNPGWCWDGKMNLMAEWAGLTYAELLASILSGARERSRRPTP